MRPSHLLGKSASAMTEIASRIWTCKEDSAEREIMIETMLALSASAVAFESGVGASST